MAGNPWAIQQAAAELDAHFTDTGVLGDATVASTNWASLYLASKQAAVPADLAYMSYEQWREDYNTNYAASATDTRTIPPATGAGSANETLAEAIAIYNLDPLHGVTVPGSGATYDIIEWWFNRGLLKASTGWHTLFKNIWDAALDNAARNLATALKSPNLTEDEAQYPIPILQMSALAQNAVRRGLTTIILDTPLQRYVTYLTGNCQAVSPAILPRLSYLRSVSGTLSATSPAVVGTFLRYSHATVALSPVAATVGGAVQSVMFNPNPVALSTAAPTVGGAVQSVMFNPNPVTFYIVAPTVGGAVQSVMHNPNPVTLQPAVPSTGGTLTVA
jgi:hypothetical protein